MFEALTATAMGKAPDETAFTPMERIMIDPALARMLQRMPAAAMDRFSKISDPLIILFVGALWARRNLPRGIENGNGNGNIDEHSSQFASVGANGNSDLHAQGKTG